MAGFEDDAPLDDPAPMKRPGKATEKTFTAGTIDPKVDDKPEAENFVATLPDAPIDVLKDEAKRNALYATIKTEIAAFVPDLSTQAGRDRVKSLAYKITRTRTALDKAGKDATADMRDKINAVNGLRNDAEAALKELETLARKPLTDWEEAEAAKAAQRGEISRQLQLALNASNASPSDDLKDLQAEITGLTIDADLWGDQAADMEARKVEVIAALDDKIELAEMREEKAKREAEEWTRQQAAQAEAQQGQADANPPAADPVHEHREVPPTETRTEAPPAAQTGSRPLTPIQQARRRVLPALAELGISEEQGKAIILAIEAGKLPGIAATYLEQTS